MLNSADVSEWPRSRRYQALRKSPACPGVAPPRKRPIMYMIIRVPSGGARPLRLRTSNPQRQALSRTKIG